MGKTLTEIAQQLKGANKKVQLVYAFNGSGKTRLSREFKKLIAPNSIGEEGAEQTELTRKKILYYNALTQDLFFWNNDLENDVEPKLIIQPNTFTKWVLQDQGQDQNIIANFQRYTDEKLTPHFNQDFSEVSFSFKRGNDVQTENIKISKGEESSFIWSLFYSLFEQVIGALNVPEPADRETNEFDQLEYVFIDDPVSSLDENHLIELAVNISELINSSKSNLKFIISTHNPTFYNVLYSETGVKTGYILRKNADGTFELEEKKGDSNTSFSYHLFLKQTIQQAIDRNDIQRYHFTLLRNMYEKTGNFLGYPRWSELLPDDKKTYYNRIIQFTSHSTIANIVVAEPTEPEKQIVAYLFNHLINTYSFWREVVVND